MKNIGMETRLERAIASAISVWELTGDLKKASAEFEKVGCGHCMSSHVRCERCPMTAELENFEVAVSVQ